ncbi:hypothetical protein GCM10023146_25690 [Nocardioides caricicola]
MVDALTLGRQELDELGAAVLLRRAEDLHQIGAEAGCLTRLLLGHVHSFEVAGWTGSPHAEFCLLIGEPDAGALGCAAL